MPGNGRCSPFPPGPLNLRGRNAMRVACIPGVRRQISGCCVPAQVGDGTFSHAVPPAPSEVSTCPSTAVCASV